MNPLPVPPVPLPKDPMVIEKYVRYAIKKAQLYKVYRAWKLRRMVNRFRNSYASPLLYKYLEWKYPKYSLFKAGRFTYPIVYFPASPQTATKPDAILVGSPNQSNPSDFAFTKDWVYNILRDLVGLDKRDSLTYMLHTLGTDPLSLSSWVGNFSMNLKTSHILEWEILESIDKYPSVTPAELDDKLIMRGLLHSKVDDPVTCGFGRASAIATSTVILHRAETGYEMWLKPRSKVSIPLDVNMLHVMPAGMFQAPTGDLKREYSVVHNFRREYLEELFNRPEPDSRAGVYDYYYNDPALVSLDSLVRKGVAQLTLLGVTVNLLNLRPEVCLLLQLETDEWLEVHGRGAKSQEMRSIFNQEFVDQIVKPNLPISTDDLPLFAPDKIVPAAAVCAWAAQDWVLRSH